MKLQKDNKRNYDLVVLVLKLSRREINGEYDSRSDGFSNISSIDTNYSIFFYLNSIIEYGEEQCQKLIEKHKECMRGLGFRV